eukprot:g30309.t2
MHGKPVHNELLVLSRSALEACQLHKLFDAPLVAKAVGFEGKVGFIEDLAVRGCLPRLGSTRGHQVAFHRILLGDAEDKVFAPSAPVPKGPKVSPPKEIGSLFDDDPVIASAPKAPMPKATTSLFDDKPQASAGSSLFDEDPLFSDEASQQGERGDERWGFWMAPMRKPPKAEDQDGPILSEQLNRLRSCARTHLHLSVGSLVYVGINICNFTINSMDPIFRKEHKVLFHRTEFWATFFFACLQVYALVGCPRQLQDVFDRPTLGVSGLREAGKQDACQSFQVAATAFTLAVALTQLCIYNFLGGPQGGPGEQLAHFFEFIFEACTEEGISGFISFLFCMNCKLDCDRAVHELVRSSSSNTQIGTNRKAMLV